MSVPGLLVWIRFVLGSGLDDKLDDATSGERRNDL